MTKIKSSEITPEHIYLSRRKFMVGIGALAATSALAACGASPEEAQPAAAPAVVEESPAEESPADVKVEEAVEAEEPAEMAESPATTDELGDEFTPFEAVTNFNNFYEFTTDKESVAGLAQDFTTSPWTVEVGGLVQQPQNVRSR